MYKSQAAPIVAFHLPLYIYCTPNTVLTLQWLYIWQRVTGLDECAMFYCTKISFETVVLLSCRMRLSPAWINQAINLIMVNKGATTSTILQFNPAALKPYGSSDKWRESQIWLWRYLRYWFGPDLHSVESTFQTITGFCCKRSALNLPFGILRYCVLLTIACMFANVCKSYHQTSWSRCLFNFVYMFDQHFVRRIHYTVVYEVFITINSLMSLYTERGLPASIDILDNNQVFLCLLASFGFVACFI